MRLFPTLSGYQKPWLRPDVIAGLTAGAVVIPQAMAYASIASMPVQVGLYTCIVPMLVYAMLGGSNALSMSTTSTIATLSASTLIAAGVAAGSVRDLTTLTLIVGVLLLLTRLLHLGSLVDNISDTVLTGVKTGVGLTVAVGQLPKLLGIKSDPHNDGFFGQLSWALKSLGSANTATVILAGGTIAGLLILTRLAPRVPAPLIAAVVALILVHVLSLPKHGVALIAPIPSGLPVPRLAPLHHIGRLLPGACAIALMAFLESVAVARGFASRNDPPLDTDRELVAVGAASVAGAFFQTMPAAGGFSQTAVSVRSGVRSQAGEIVTVVLAVLVALFLAPTLSSLPQATLGSMVIVATLGLIKPAEFRRLARISPVEFWLALVTAVVGLTGGLLAAVAVGVLGTFALVLHELNRPDVIELRADADGHLRVADGTPSNGLLVLRLGGPLYTANARAAQRSILAGVDAADPKPEVVILDVGALGRVSVTVLDALRDLDRSLQERHVTLWLAGLPDRALETARRTTWWHSWEESGRVWRSAEDAVAAHR
jgi:sulfate permease, SulP family